VVSLRRASLVVLSVLALFAGLLISPGHATAASPSQFVVINTNADRERVPDLEEETTTSRVVVEFADPSRAQLAAPAADWKGRGAQVAATLRTRAAAAQAQALDLVRSKGAKASSFWIHNAVVVEGADTALRSQLARLPGVLGVHAERVYPIEEPRDVRQASLDEGSHPEWGVAKIGADKAWAQGVLGGGVVVGSIDSGVDFSHPAIVQQYRGNKGDGTFDHSYNWFDAAGVCITADPCDLYGHGTHTMGTMVGGDGPGPFSPDVGVAPGATWMSASCGPNFCTESQLMAAGQFILEPFDSQGANPDASKRPSIVNNSWGLGRGDTTALAIVQAWRAAGIVPVFSNGNAGPSCGTSSSPAEFAESLAVGATDRNDAIAGFSSRGPSVYGGIGKPDVSAPGVDVTSSAPGGGYRASSGTSMAAPHVAGQLALMMSAKPELRGDADAAIRIAGASALDILDSSCGGDPTGDPNNVFGEGRIDAATAVQIVATGGHLTGTVVDAATSQPLAGVRVRLSNDGDREFQAITDTGGAIDLLLPAGTYTATAELFGFVTEVRSGITIAENETTTVALALTAAPQRTVSGLVVAAESGKPVAGARVEAVGVPVPAVVTDSSGRYSLSLPAGRYTLEASLGGCLSPRTVEVNLASNQQVDIRLAAKTDSFGHGCAPADTKWVNARHDTTLFGTAAYGRLRLPFSFPFYDGNHQEVFITTDGYLSFTDPTFVSSFNSAIPSTARPNNAIYALWQNLTVTGDATVRYDFIANDTKAVISYDGVLPLGSTEPVSFQVHLSADGTIDVVYRDLAGADGGSAATIGLENASGTDALPFAFNEPHALSNTAWRYREVTSATATGLVLDANDSTPVVGATVTADPGGRTAITGPDGRYTLKLLVGSYRLTADAGDYESAFADVRAQRGATIQVPTLHLRAPIAGITPATLELTAPAGGSATGTVTVRNTGSSPLDWDVRELEQRGTTTGATEMAPIGRLTGLPTWGRSPELQQLLATTPVTAVPHSAPVLPIITDPAGDGGLMDLIGVSGGSDTETLSMRLDFTPLSDLGLLNGYVMLDSDQNVNTGIRAGGLIGVPSQDLGAEHIVDLSAINDPVPSVTVLRLDTLEVLGPFPAAVSGQSVSFDIPVRALVRNGEAEDGSVNLGVATGDLFVPIDWAPDAGHGTIQAATDAPWLTVTPTSGVVATGGSMTLEVAADAATLPPGEHDVELRFRANDPRRPDIRVLVRFLVT
jgi:subtilisin family serine protease